MTTKFALPLKPYHLKHGSHTSREEGMCLLELAAYLAGRKHSDMPQCVAPSIRRMGISLNDRLDDERRQILRPYLLRMLGTATDGREEERRQMCTEWLLHYALPKWLDLAGRQEAAQRLRELPGDLAVEGVRRAIRDARDEAWDARSKARASLRQRVLDELRKRGVTAATTAATAATAAATATTAAAATAAAATATATAAATATTATDATAAAADATDATAAAADATATATDAAAAATTATAAAATTDAAADYWSRRQSVYDAVYKAVRSRVEKVIKPTADEVFDSAIELFDRMLPPEPLVEPAVEGAEIICAPPEAA